MTGSVTDPSTPTADPSAGTGGSAAVTPTTATPTDPGTAPVTSTSTTAPNPTASTPPTAASGGPIRLRLAVSKGSEIKYQSESESTQKFGGAAAGKMPEPKPMKATSQTSVKVVDVTGGKSKVEISVSGMKLSGGPDGEEAKKMMTKMAQDSEGVKVSVLFDNLAQPSNLQYLKGTKAQASQAGIDTDSGFFGISYPEKAVKPGDTWSHTFDFKSAIGAMGPMKGTTWKDSDITTVFTLKSVDSGAGTAVIAISAKGSPAMTMSTAGMPQPKGATKADMPKEIVMNFNVSGTGSCLVDLKTGTPKEISYEMSVEFKSPMGVVGQKTKASLRRIN